MSLKCRRLEAEHAMDAWRCVAATCTYTTFFETEAWASVLQSAFPAWSPDPIAVEFSDGNLMVVPIMRRRAFGGVVRYGESMLPGVYGGPLFLQMPQDEHWQLAWEIVGSVRDTVVYTNPYLPKAGPFPAAQRTGCTHALDLTPGLDALRKGFQRRHRRNTQSAERRGVVARMAVAAKDVDAYFGVYQDTLKRWGRKAAGFYPQRLFRGLFACPEYGYTVKLWVATLDERVIGGGWTFADSERVIYWHSSFHSQYLREYHPAHLVADVVIRDACQSGFRWFDFNPSAGLDGVEEFKASFGPRRLEFPIYRRLTAAGKAFRAYRHLNERYLRQCPL